MMFTRSCFMRAALLPAGMLVFFNCSETPQNAEKIGDAPRLFITESDYQSGQLEWMTTDNQMIASSNISIHSDAVVTSFEGFLYVIERYGADNIIKFDPEKNDEDAVVYQHHFGDNWNPQDMAFVSSTKAYISCNNEPKILIFNPTDDDVTAEIDISPYTFMPDSNSSPYANDLQLVGSDLYVLLQRRNGYKPGAPTLLLKINTETDEITDTIACTYMNGYAMAYHDDALYISNPGSVRETGDGGIEKVDLSTKEVSTIIDENDFGGNPNQIVHKDGSIFYVINYISWKNTKVIEIDMKTGNISTLPDIHDAFGGIYYDAIDERLYVGERDSTETGIRIFEDNKQIGSTITTKNSLPPTSMVVVR